MLITHDSSLTLSSSVLSFFTPRQWSATMAAACSEYLLFFSHELEQKFLPATLTTEVKVFSVPTVTYLGSSFPSVYRRSSSNQLILFRK